MSDNFRTLCIKRFSKPDILVELSNHFKSAAQNYIYIYIYQPFRSPVYRFERPNLRNLENVLQRNLRTDTARECIFRASGGIRFKSFRQPWWRKGEGGTPRCNRSAQKNSGYVTDICINIFIHISVYNFPPINSFLSPESVHTQRVSPIHIQPLSSHVYQLLCISMNNLESL